jgi:hypothetical protein
MLSSLNSNIKNGINIRSIDRGNFDDKPYRHTSVNGTMETNMLVLERLADTANYKAIKYLYIDDTSAQFERAYYFRHELVYNETIKANPTDESKNANDNASPDTTVNGNTETQISAIEKPVDSTNYKAIKCINTDNTTVQIVPVSSFNNKPVNSKTANIALIEEDNFVNNASLLPDFKRLIETQISAVKGTLNTNKLEGIRFIKNYGMLLISLILLFLLIIIKFKME